MIGPSGTGKTLLCQVLVEQFRDAFETVHLIERPVSTRRALLQAILLGSVSFYRGWTKGCACRWSTI